MKYGFQVKVYNSATKSHEWKFVHPTGGAPYSYPTADEAQVMADMCYPDEHEGVRVYPIGAV